MRKLYGIQPDVVWFLLNSLSTDENTMHPPHVFFPKFQFAEEALQRNMYTDNIAKIISE